jgi:hypothetical protein
VSEQHPGPASAGPRQGKTCKSQHRGGGGLNGAILCWAVPCELPYHPNDPTLNHRDQSTSHRGRTCTQPGGATGQTAAFPAQPAPRPATTWDAEDTRGCTREHGMHGDARIHTHACMHAQGHPYARPGTHRHTGTNYSNDPFQDTTRAFSHHTREKPAHPTAFLKAVSLHAIPQPQQGDGVGGVREREGERNCRGTNNTPCPLSDARRQR